MCTRGCFASIARALGLDFGDDLEELVEDAQELEGLLHQMVELSINDVRSENEQEGQLHRDSSARSRTDRRNRA